MLKVNICEKQGLISGHCKNQRQKACNSLRQQTDGRQPKAGGSLQ